MNIQSNTYPNSPDILKARHRAALKRINCPAEIVQQVQVILDGEEAILKNKLDLIAEYRRWLVYQRRFDKVTKYRSRMAIYLVSDADNLGKFWIAATNGQQAFDTYHKAYGNDDLQLVSRRLPGESALPILNVDEWETEIRTCAEWANACNNPCVIGGTEY